MRTPRWLESTGRRKLTLPAELQVLMLNAVLGMTRDTSKIGISPQHCPELQDYWKPAREKGATMLISGTYNIVPEQADTAAVITVTVKIAC
ncbi:MAG: hypothetical protein R2682_14045 [Pyrinomonadaceae bacterium]